MSPLFLEQKYVCHVSQGQLRGNIFFPTAHIYLLGTQSQFFTTECINVTDYIFRQKTVYNSLGKNT